MTDKPMHRKDRQLSQEEAWKALAQGTHGVLCLAGEDGWPYGVPMNYVLLDGSLYLHCARSGYKLEAIARDQRVCFTVVTKAQVIPEHITTLYESVMVLGRAYVVEHPQEHDAALAALINTLGRVTPEIRDQYIAKKSKNTTVVRIRPLRLTGKASRQLIPVTQRM